jgi:hypothetical protein
MEIVTLVLMVLAALASLRWGADSRDGRDWQPRGEWEVREQMGRARARTVLQ